MTRAEPKAIPIAEVFGPTIQGEGALAGQPTYFVRVGGCDYNCSWCDSGHAVNAEAVRDLPRLTQEQIYDQLQALPMGPEWLTLSGGNPALYDLTELVELWQGQTPSWGIYKVAVETQGSKWHDWLAKVDLLTISPKPPSSGLDADTSALNLEAFLDRMHNISYVRQEGRPGLRVVFKMVVFDEEDYEFARDTHALHSYLPFYLSVGTAMGGLTGNWPPPVHPREVAFSQPQVDTTDSLLERYRWLAERTMKDQDMADVAVFPQLHVLLWGHVRGV